MVAFTALGTSGDASAASSPSGKVIDAVSVHAVPDLGGLPDLGNIDFGDIDFGDIDFGDIDFGDIGNFPGGGFPGIPGEDPCQPTLDTGTASWLKTVSYRQDSTADPRLEAEDPAAFFAGVTPVDENPVSSATLVMPDGSPKPLTSFFGVSSFLLFESGGTMPTDFSLPMFASPAEMDAAFPNGVYRFQITAAEPGTGSITLNVSNATYPPVPKIANYESAQQIDPAADFVLAWNPFTGASEMDSISLSISDDSGVAFNAPDACVPRELANSASSIVIPAGTLSGGKTYEGTLTFTKAAAHDETSIPDLTGFAALGNHLNFTLRTTGEPAGTGQPEFLGIQRLESGAIQLQAKVQPGPVYLLEASPDLETWTTINTIIPTMVPANGVVELEDPDTGADRRFYRLNQFQIPTFP